MTCTLTVSVAPPALEQLKAHLNTVQDLKAMGELLHWDQSTYMPTGGAQARARQSATVKRLAHEHFTQDQVGYWLEEVEPYGLTLPYGSTEASLIRLVRKEFTKARRVPACFMAQVAEHSAHTYEAWIKAYAQNDFSLVRSKLERTLELSQQLAGYFAPYDHIADPLIDFADPGMKARSIHVLFSQLEAHLIPMVQQVLAQSPLADQCLRQHFPEEAQLSFGLEAIKAFGYDFGRGRQDKTHHPFMTKFSLGDVRITTRIREDDPREAIFSTLHEAGHALYEQGIDPSFEALPLAEGVSAGVHESQSRLWENLVGRSRGFWEHFYPRLQRYFPDQLGSITLETFYRAINKVERSLIRTDADELTYNLHVMLRFDLELALLEGRLAVKDLPEAWNEGMRARLGLVPSTAKEGVLQDVHWFDGLIGGAFQGYTLGNIMAAQFYQAALAAEPAIHTDIQHGQFGRLHTWLKTHVYQHGSKFTPDELIRQATGQPLGIEAYLGYIRTKYGEIYALSL